MHYQSCYCVMISTHVNNILVENRCFRPVQLAAYSLLQLSRLQATPQPPEATSKPIANVGAEISECL